MNNVFSTKLPYVFWFLNFNENEVNIDEERRVFTNSQGKEYAIKPFNKIAFFAIKYLPVVAILCLVFNKFDFLFSDFQKVIEHIVGLLLAAVTLLSKRIFAYSAIFIFLISSLLYIESAPFIVKYYLLYLILINFSIDAKKRIYSVLEGKRTLAHLILE